MRGLDGGCPAFYLYLLCASVSRTCEVPCGGAPEHLPSAFWDASGARARAQVIPNVQSLTADYYRAEDRGKVFGTLHLTSAAGAALGGLYATNVGVPRAPRVPPLSARR